MGHRGLVRPGLVENTADAVSAAFAVGCDGVEVDVRLTADGSLVCLHDETFGRVAGRPVVVAETPYADLKARAARRGFDLATIADVLRQVPDGATIVVEMKRQPAAITAVLPPVLAGEAGRIDIVVSSFSPNLLRCLRGHLDASPARAGAPIRRALLGEPGRVLSELADEAVLDRTDALHVHLSTALDGATAVDRVHELGLELGAWTVNRPVDLHCLAVAGFDLVITDEPAQATAVRDRQQLALAGR